MTTQAPSSILMIRPAAFGFNAQTADSNTFQQFTDDGVSEVHQKALQEFGRMVDLLRSHDIDVHVLDDTPLPIKPDAIFPNNWISFHEDGRVVVYPMMAENRRTEKRTILIESLAKFFAVSDVIDWSEEENHNRFLEGTGSMVFDYVHGIGYACRSPRTDESLVKKLCATLGYQAVVFDAVDASNQPIYHTNVMMCIGTSFAVVCLDAIRNDKDQEILLASLTRTNHKVVAISYDQMNAFAGNMIEVKSKNNEPFVLLSARAFNSLLHGQIDAISRYAEMIPIAVPTIETYGGGSVRCMVAGIFNVKR